MNSKYISRYFWAELGAKPVTKGILQTQKSVEESPRFVDLDDYAKKLEKCYNDFDEWGYDVVNVVPIQMGQREGLKIPLNSKLSVAYSITRGAVVIGRLRDS